MPLSNPVKNNSDLSKTESWKMFDRISQRYDFLNRLFSLGLDVVWRKRLVRYLPNQINQVVVDIATGTADVLLYLFQQNSNISRGDGIDLAENMLAIGRQKVQARQLQDKIVLQHGDAQQIPFPANQFDAATIAFGIRNMAEPVKVLKEIFRVLKPQGRALVLEFSLPQNRFLRSIYLIYLRHFIPALGTVLSGDGGAYRYLNRTVETFPSGRDFCALMESVGFKNIVAHPLTFGVATIYQGDKF